MGTFYVFITDGETSRQIGHSPSGWKAQRMLQDQFPSVKIYWHSVYDFVWFAYATNIEGRALGSVRYLKYATEPED